VVDDSKRCARVQAALSDASNLFAHEGTIKEPNGLWDSTKWMPLFSAALSDDEQHAVAQTLEQKKLPIDALLKVASQASFGKDGETIYDPKVRRAFEIPRSQLPSDLLDVLKISSIERLEYAMKPEMKKWTYHLYKIHMYGPGGKFEDHADTLHKSNHVATVVLSLPSEHVGGILHHGETMEFDSSKGPITQDWYDNKYTALRYGAFFTDCTHSVQEVLSGWRVVVQYDVYEETVNEGVNSEEKTVSIDRFEEHKEILFEKGDQHTIDRVFECLLCGRVIGTSMIHDKEQTELVQAVSQYMAQLPLKHCVAFFLRHRYSLPALNEVVLKGADRIIYDAFSRRTDFSISFKGVLAYFETDERSPISLQVKAVSMKDFVPYVDDQEKLVDPDNYTEGKVDSSSTVHLIVDDDNGAVCVHETGGFMGNEASDDCTSYFVACMIIESN
jgi:hypothetical protein